MSANGLSRKDFARIAQTETALLSQLRAAVVRRSGEENATALHDDAAASFHRLFDAAGGDEARRERD